MKKAFCGAQVYSSAAHSFHKATLLVEDGRILAVTKQRPAADETVDCSGKWIVPGLVDVHTHGRIDLDFSTVPEEKLEALLLSYARTGTTSLMATMGSDTLDVWRAAGERMRKAAQKPPRGARVAGIHWEGRYLSEKRRGAHALSLLSEPKLEELDVLLGDGSCAVHISEAPELPGSEEFVREAVRRGATVGIAHTDCTYETAQDALIWGATSFTHTYNAMSPLHHRNPGCIGASLISDGAYSEFICDGFHSHPEMARLLYRAKPAGKLVLITDSVRSAGCADGEYFMAGLCVTVKDGRALTEEGAIAGSMLTLLEGVRNFMRFTGAPLTEVLPMATENPAKMVGIDRMVGSLESGRYADFLILSDPASVALDAVVLGGEIL